MDYPSKTVLIGAVDLSAMVDLGDDELLTTGEAGRLIGLASEYMRRLAMTGKLPAMQLRSGHWLFRKADIKEFVSHRQSTPYKQLGRPLKKLRVADELK